MSFAVVASSSAAVAAAAASGAGGCSRIRSSPSSLGWLRKSGFGPPLLAVRPQRGVPAPSAAFSDEPSEKSDFWSLIRDIEPLDTSVIQKDVPAETVDAMKITISSMLGLLPSEQFGVLIEAPWSPFVKLLISSIKTGYTLRNAEYRLAFERKLEFSHWDSSKREKKDDNSCSTVGGCETIYVFPDELPNFEEKSEESSESLLEGLDSLSTEAKYVIDLMQTHLKSVKKELNDLKRRNAALQMQRTLGEGKNDLLDYLRSLTPEKVSELSEPTCSDIREAIHSIVHGLLANLSLRIYSKAPPPTKNAGSNTLNIREDDCAELVEDASLHLQPVTSVPRDYLGRLLFWCMLLGHYIRSLECQLELTRLLTISSD